MSPGRPSADAGENHSLPASSQSKAETLDATVAGLADLDAGQLRLQWRNHSGGTAPAHLPRWLLLRALAYRLQAAALGDLDKATVRCIRAFQGDAIESACSPFKTRKPRTRDGTGLNPGALLVREWRGKLERVMVLDKGFAWNGKTFGSLSQVAKAITGASWNGHRFFGLRSAKDQGSKRGVARPTANQNRRRGVPISPRTSNAKDPTETAATKLNGLSSGQNVLGLTRTGVVKLASRNQNLTSSSKASPIGVFEEPLGEAGAS